jgi:hypothetical protein
VATRRKARGQGHGRHLVTAARQAMAVKDLDLGLFTCDRPAPGVVPERRLAPAPSAVLIGETRLSPLPSDQLGFVKVVMADFSRREPPPFQHVPLGAYGRDAGG